MVTVPHSRDYRILCVITCLQQPSLHIISLSDRVQAQSEHEICMRKLRFYSRIFWFGVEQTEHSLVADYWIAKAD
jgi:hypothetical protein